MNLRLLGEGDLRELVNGRAHWIVLFAEDSMWAIDELDRALDVWPTYPTIVGRVTATIVPKADITVERIGAALRVCSAGEEVAEISDEHDILTVSRSPELALWALLMLKQVCE